MKDVFSVLGFPKKIPIKSEAIKYPIKNPPVSSDRQIAPLEPNAKKVGYIVGGARKRAAYYILSTKKKDIVGVYFQSHEGEVFFQLVTKREPKNPPKKKVEKPKIQEEKLEEVNSENIEDKKN